MGTRYAGSLETVVPGSASPLRGRLPLPETLLERPRLLAVLDEPATVTLVTAPAGFGKSALVAQWARRSDLPVHWVSLRPNDNHGERLESRVIAALEDEPAFRGGGGREDDAACLVLDNVEVLTSAGSREVLDRLINGHGSCPRLVVVGRNAACLRLSRLRAMRRVTAIDGEDLRFSLPEAHALLDGNPARLNREQVRELWSITKGWVAGMMLAVTAGEASHSSSVFGVDEWKKWDALLDAYYLEEVIEPLPDDLRTFLFEFADLPLLTPAIRAPGRHDVRDAALLAQLAARSLVTVADGADASRYLLNPLFAASLRRIAATRLAPVDRRPMVRWLCESGEVRAAAGLALQIDDEPWIERAMRLLGEDLVRNSLFDELIRWMDRVPDDLVSRNPDFQYWRIVARLGLGRTFQAGQMIDEAEAGWIATGDPMHIGRASLLRGMLAYWEGQGGLAASHLEGALVRLPPDADMERLYAHTFLGNQAFREGRDDDAERPLRAAELTLRHQPIHAQWGWRTVAADRANAYAIRGDLCSAMTKYRLMLAELPGPLPGIEGFLRCRLLALQLERGLLDEAAANFERIDYLLGIDEVHWQPEVGAARGQAMLERRGEVADWRHDAAIARTRILLATGRHEEAENWASGYLKLVRHLPRKNQLVLMLAYIWLERGELPMVRSWLRDVGPSPWPWADQFGDINPVVLAIDLDLAEGAFEAAAGKAQAMVDEARSRRRWAEFTGLSTRLAIARRELGDREGAAAHLVDALRVGLKGGFARSFDVPGFALAGVFREDWERIRGEPGIGEHVRLLHDAIAGEDRLLTRREAEVLALVAEGKSNKEIAATLYISVNTVRNHLARMGKRLRTGSRTELVARARQVGILA